MKALRPLVLVIAQSARFLAQQAAREGYRVRAIDQFNDADLISVCEQTSSFADFNQLNLAGLRQNIIQLAGESPATLIAGTGAEIFYPLFNQLPPQITVANNTQECFQQCHRPEQWFALLEKLQIPHPKTCFAKPTSSNQWLFKPTGGWGGMGIQSVSAHSTDKSGVYQRLIHGQPFSVLFFADRSGWQWLSTQSQHSLPDRFIHQRMHSHFSLSLAAQAQVTSVIDQLNRTLQLRGFNSMDFILTEHAEVLLLELNARPAASMQFLDSPALITTQISACIDDRPAHIEPASRKQTLVYLFASHSGHIRHQAHWPECCHDLPTEGQFIRAGDVVCSALFPTTEEFPHEFASLNQQVMQNIFQ